MSEKHAIDTIKEEWFGKVKECCLTAGTYKEEFDSVIETLADILSIRDAAMLKFTEEGSHPVTPDSRGTLRKNPLLAQILELDRDALAYWRDLGLTPKGLKTLDNQSLKGTNKDGFEEALKGLVT